MAIAERTQKLFLADAHRNDTVGVSVLDAFTHDAVGFVPLLRAAFLLPIPAGAVDTDEVILAVGTTVPAQSHFELERAQGWFFFVDPVTTEVRDSFPFLPAVDSAAGGLASIVSDPTGRWAYFSTYANNLYRMIS
jgi:hypothetical protein